MHTGHFFLAVSQRLPQLVQGSAIVFPSILEKVKFSKYFDVFLKLQNLKLTNSEPQIFDDHYRKL